MTADLMEYNEGVCFPVDEQCVVTRQEEDLHLSGCPIVTYEYVGHPMFSLHIERCTLLALPLTSSLSCQSGEVVCGSLFVVLLLILLPCHLFFHPCLFSERDCLKCSILSSCSPLFAVWSAFSLLGIPVWAGIQLIVVIYGNLDAASLMALLIVFKSSFLLL